MWVAEKMAAQIEQLRFRLSKRNKYLADTILENIEGEPSTIKIHIAKIAADELIRNQLAWISLCFTEDAYENGYCKFPYADQYDMLSILKDPDQPAFVEGQTDREILTRRDINWNIPLVHAVLKRHGLK